MPGEEEKDLVKQNEENYIKTIADLKENTIPKEEYQKLLDQNKQLLDTLANGGNMSTDAPEVVVDIKAIRGELFAEDSTLSNLDYAVKTLELRKELMKRGYDDPFLPVGKDVVITEIDRAGANRVAEALQHCIDIAEGDAEVFDREFGRILR